MPRGVRYTKEEKAQMREKALKMKAGGASQKAIADELGVAIPTARDLLGGASKASKGGAKRSAKEPALPKSHPAIRMAEKQARLEAIDGEIEKLEDEREQIGRELKTLYKELGNEILGSKESSGSEAAPSNPARKNSGKRSAKR